MNKLDIHKLVASKVNFELEQMVSAFEVDADIMRNFDIHTEYSPLHRALLVYVKAAVHSLTKDSNDVEYETVEKTFDASLDKVITVTTEEPASWWQHFKKQRGWLYSTKQVDHKIKISVTGPVNTKFTVPVKKVYKKVFLGLPTNELATRVYTMYPESDYEKSDEYWREYIMKHKEAAMYMAPVKYRSTVKEVAVR